jgi:hypothetical protein
MALIATLAGCTETGIDPGSGSNVVRTRDTVTIEVTRRDTVVQKEIEVITDTLIKEITVNDTLVRIDTIVRYDTVPRTLLRQATIYKDNRWGFRDSVVVDIKDFTRFEVTGPATAPDIAFESLMPIGRWLPVERFGPHGWSILYISVPRRPLQYGSVKLTRDPDYDAGASITIGDHQYETGDEIDGGPLKSFGDFLITGIDTQRRTITVQFRATFFIPGTGSPKPPPESETVSIGLRLGY